ncbi:hypothetical protein GCM10018790_37440 [Kitasatospora xanthocidica]|uniref:hypothetical protein n=1 Tax=Kitasatospora xanthocidica TaxID=83382 RepID=UPI00167290E6|nr:hypothetical protein [Kitasatospora xanthocidica]GHF56004.1 hypothetical protein GCM10018790_37440 [Kitasatospora xanthocidica]
MPDFGGGLAKMTVMSAVVASAAFGLATPSHAAAPQAPVSAAHRADEPADTSDTATPVHPVTDRQNQGHY